MKKKIQILGMKLDNYSVRESILLAESYLNGTSLNAIEDISMKMLMESENNEVLGQALQELDMTIIGEKEILTAAEVETPQRLKETVSNTAAFLDKAKRYTDIQALTPELLRLFIERIEVGERTEKYSRSSHQSIRIVYRDIGTVDSAMEQGEAQPRIAPPLSEVFQLPA